MNEKGLSPSVIEARESEKAALRDWRIMQNPELRRSRMMQELEDRRKAHVQDEENRKQFMLDWEEQVAPHPNVAEMKRIVDAATAASALDVQSLDQSLRRFIDKASHEEWQLTMQYLWDGRITEVDWLLFNSTSRLLELGSALGKDLEEVTAINLVAFQETPGCVDLSDAEAVSGMANKARVLESLFYAERRRETAERCQQKLTEWEKEAKLKGVKV